MQNFLLSSTGEGVKLRIKSLALLIIPVVNSILEANGIQVISNDSVDVAINSVFVVWFLITHAYAWIRFVVLKYKK